LVRAVHS